MFRFFNFFLQFASKPIPFLIYKPQVKTVVPVIACEDRLLRVMRDAEVVYSVEVPSTPSTLHLFYGDAGETGDLVLYATNDGRIGLLQLGRFFMK